MNSRPSFFGRLAQLFRGIFGVKLERAEVEHAEAVYHQALIERRRHYDELREAAGRLVFLRNKSELARKTAHDDIGLVEQALRRAALDDDDTRALALMKKKRELQDAVSRHEGEVVRLAERSVRAKESLEKLARAIDELKNERSEMLARKAHAQAQLQAQAALEQALSGRATHAQAALENVRESISRLEGQAELSEGNRAEDISLSDLRRDAALQGDAAALSALKHELRGHLLPAKRPVGVGV